METFFQINGRRIGPGCPVYVVAEISANHERDFDQAVKLLQAAKKAGADAVKLQTYTPDTMTLKSDRECFRIGGGTLWDGQTFYDLYQRAYMPWEWQPPLKSIAEDLGLDFFSTAFDPSAVDFLETLNVPVHKIASFEIVDLPLIEKIGHTRKPLIISTGMATLEEIGEAVETARRAGASQIALLKCTSAYPAPADEMNLRTMAHLAENFQVPVGISDHTLGGTVPSVAVALGACLVEKHFTLSRKIPGPDSAFSLEAAEFKTMVDSIRETEKALGGIHYGMTEKETQSIVFRRSLFVVQDIKAGEVFTTQNIRPIRPSQGLPPKYMKDILGSPASCDIARGTPLAWEHVLLHA